VPEVVGAGEADGHAGGGSGNDLAGKSNAYIAALFQQDFLQKGMKLDAQVLATALAVYVTNATLGNTGVGAAYGASRSAPRASARRPSTSAVTVTLSAWPTTPA
jgi:hypothetical protein